ncbi:hypothetical protein I4U23_004620 [Adineta vaga]|nr:hypothetical protein I4U23_004620 [Adineta vaga]
MMSNDLSLNRTRRERITSSQNNCSTLNLCGKYGYCEDHFDGSWTCDCKFWWSGKFIKQWQTSYYSWCYYRSSRCRLLWLALYRSISKKCRQPKAVTPKTVTQKSSFLPTIKTTGSSYRISSWITLIGTVILGICATIIKGIALNGIHKEIIDKLHNNQSLFYNRPSFCDRIYVQDDINIVTFPIACFLILLFVILTAKRQSFQRKQTWKNYFALPIPLDFFTCVQRTFSAVIFAIFADELFTIAIQLINGNTSTTDKGIIINYALQIFKVLIIGFRCYPMLAAVYIDSRFSLFCATLYAWLDFGLILASDGVCRNEYYLNNVNFNQSAESDFTIVYLDYYGHGSKLIFFQLLFDIPRYCFLGYISTELPKLFFQRMRNKRMESKQLTSEEKHLLHSSLPWSTEYRYVQKLFGFNNQKKLSSNLFQRIYLWQDDFQFSARVLCVYASIFCLLFFLTVQACVQVPPILHSLHNVFENIINALINISAEDDVRLKQLKNLPKSFPLPNLVYPYLIAIFTALTVSIIQLLVLFAAIRRNLLQAFRGNSTEITRYDSSKNVNYACQNIHFAGYLIAYVLWAYILIAVFTMIVGTVINVVIIYGMIRSVESVVKIIIPPILFAIFQTYMNKIVGQYIFLQQAGEVLSINHRRILMIFLYFNFFLDAFLGLISSIMRVIKSAIGGMIYMSRLDYSPMGRKLETFDAGFNAYCAFIHIECAHRHPVLLYFTSILLREHLYKEETIHWTKARHRWYLAVFLLRNPTLIYRRKKSFSQSQMEKRMMFIGRKNIKTMTIQDQSVYNQQRKSSRKGDYERF